MVGSFVRDHSKSCSAEKCSSVANTVSIMVCRCVVIRRIFCARKFMNFSLALCFSAAGTIPSLLSGGYKSKELAAPRSLGFVVVGSFSILAYNVRMLRCSILCGLLVICANVNAAEGVKMRTIAQGNFSGVQAATQVVVTNAAQWQDLWKKHSVH